MQTEKRLEIQFQYLIDLKSYTDHVWTSRIEVHALARSRLSASVVVVAIVYEVELNQCKDCIVVTPKRCL